MTRLRVQRCQTLLQIALLRAQLSDFRQERIGLRKIVCAVLFHLDNAQCKLVSLLLQTEQLVTVWRFAHPVARWRMVIRMRGRGRGKCNGRGFKKKRKKEF
uniref:Uncharacterized protein n=1 Tax=Cacopsylla melanoneura TaxID=428564 RepID=A0A8D8ZS50_9HEMI